MKQYVVIFIGFLLVSGCSSGPRTYAQGSSEYLDDYQCRQEMQSGKGVSFHSETPYKTYEECRADKIYVGEMLSRAAPPPGGNVNVIINR